MNVKLNVKLNDATDGTVGSGHQREVGGKRVGEGGGGGKCEYEGEHGGEDEDINDIMAWWRPVTRDGRFWERFVDEAESETGAEAETQSEAETGAREAART
jgi:hypothetical protein